MFEHIIANAQSIAIAGGLALVMGLAAKKLPAMLEAKVKAALERLFERGDAADDAWLIATIVWAEAKLGPNAGAAKAALVVDRIIGLLPMQYRVFVTKGVREKAVTMFQASYDRVMAAAHKAEIEHGATGGL
jgi:hypothetical protein